MMMPENPEHRLNKPLKSLAEKRRRESGPDFDLHAANRRLLQSEVRKQYGKTAAPARSWRLGLLALWPRLAVALGIFVALGFIVVQMNPDRPEEINLAQAEREQHESVEESSLPSTANAFRENEDPSAKSDVAKSEMSRDSAVPLRRAKTEPEDEPMPLAQSGMSLAEARSTDALPPTAAEPSASVSSKEQLYLGEFVAQSPSEGIHLRRQSAPPSRRVSTLPEVAEASPFVLTQFQLIQDSNRIRIIDADGSVYEGAVAVEDPAAAESVAENEARALASAPVLELERPFTISAGRSGAPANISPVAGSNAWRFVVSGTNRSIDAPIHLSGILHSLQPATVLQQSMPEADALAQAAAPDEDQPAVFMVEGLLRIGTNEPLRLRASQIIP